jgi:hypothetical protein
LLRPYRNAICRGLSQCFLQDLRGLLLHVGEQVCRRFYQRKSTSAIAYRDTQNVCSIFVLRSGNGHNGTRDEDQNRGMGKLDAETVELRATLGGRRSTWRGSHEPFCTTPCAAGTRVRGDGMKTRGKHYAVKMHLVAALLEMAETHSKLPHRPTRQRSMPMSICSLSGHFRGRPLGAFSRSTTFTSKPVSRKSRERR